MLRKIISFFLTAVFFCVTHSIAFANDLPVFYAGFAFVGNAADIQKNYHHTWVISNEKDREGGLILEKVLRDKVIGATFGNIKLIIDQLGDLNKGEGISVAFAFYNETVAVEKICDKYKVVIDLGAQALFFDFNEKKIIGCYPIDFQLIDNLSCEPKETYIRNCIRDLFVSEKYKINIFNSFVDRLKQIEINPKFSSSIQVTDVIIEDRAIAFLPQHLKSSPVNCKTYIAQNFSKFLSNNQGVSVLPYTKGAAIGNKMAARFANGTVYNLKIPDPQYEIDLTLRGFKKVEGDSTNIESAWIYGAYINLKVFQPLLGKVYIDEQFKNGSAKRVPACQSLADIDDWPAFQDSLFYLFDKLTKEFATEKKFKPVKKILERCK